MIHLSKFKFDFRRLFPKMGIGLGIIGLIGLSWYPIICRIHEQKTEIIGIISTLTQLSSTLTPNHLPKPAASRFKTALLSHKAYNIHPSPGCIDIESTQPATAYALIKQAAIKTGVCVEALSYAASPTSSRLQVNYQEHP